MITLPKKFFFALEAVLYIACQPGDQPVSSKEISNKHGLAPRYLEPIMQQLVHAGILRGVRGPKGGYFLARERRKITAAEIFILIQNLEDERKEAEGFSTSPLGKTVIAPLWETLESHIIQQLENTTLEDLCKMAELNNVQAGVGNKSGDFVI